MRVAVEDPVAEDHRHPRLGDEARELGALRRREAEPADLGERDAVEVLEREHPCRGVAPVDLRDGDAILAGEGAPQRVAVAPFEAVVELGADAVRELVDERARVDEVERAHALAQERARAGRGARGRPRSAAPRRGAAP